MSNLRISQSLQVLSRCPRRYDFLSTPLPATRRHLGSKLKRYAVLKAPEDAYHLPPLDEWRKYFSVGGEMTKRFCLSNPDTANILADAFVPEGSRDKVIIEAYPGAGTLTRALLDLPKERIKRLIVLESTSDFIPYLKALEKRDPRVVVYPLPGQDWETYTKLEVHGEMKAIQKVPWDAGVHPQLQFIMHTSLSVHGEQLISQLVRAIPGKQWLFQYGRVPLNLLIAQRMWDRIRAPVCSNNRCKVSVIAEAAAEFTETVPQSLIHPFGDHFFPNMHKFEQRNSYLDTRRLGNPISALTMLPLPEPYIKPNDLNVWDFCLRKMFVQKATPLERAISTLGPGAANLLPKLVLRDGTPLDISINPRSMNVEQWEAVINAFKTWPFKPSTLEISTFYETNTANR